MKVLVTGGGGFLGSRIAHLLRERGNDVVVLGRRDYPHLRTSGIETIRGDIQDIDVLRLACEGCAVVFHTAALTGVWGPTRLFWYVNVTGTLNVIAACRERGVERLVYTS